MSEKPAGVQRKPGELSLKNHFTKLQERLASWKQNINWWGVAQDFYTVLVFKMNNCSQWASLSVNIVIYTPFPIHGKSYLALTVCSSRSKIK